MAKDNFTARVAELDIELGMSVQNASGIWCKPTVRMSIGERKSIPVEWCRENGVQIAQKKKRVRYSYDLGEWFGRYFANGTV